MVLKKAKMGVGGPERSRMPESGRFNHINGRIWSLRIEGASTSRVFSSNHISLPCIKTYSWKGTNSSLFFASRIFRPCIRNRVCLDFTFPTNPNTTGKDVEARP